jgi:hypothetical protein
MWCAPTKNQLAKIPMLYSTEKTPLQDKIIYMHFFLGGSDWYIAEFDSVDLLWGYAILNGDLQNAEWGYISLQELKNIKVRGMEVERDRYWKPVKFSEIKS